MQKSNSIYYNNSSPNFDFKVTKDSNYNSLFNDKSNSKFNTSIKAMDIKRIIQEFKKEKVTLFNPYNEIKAIMEIKLEKWEK